MTAPNPRADGAAPSEVLIEYDATGRRTKLTMPLSAPVVTSYALGQVTRTITPTDDAVPRQLVEQRDAFGRLVGVVEYRGPGDANGVVTSYEYDGNDNIRRIVRSADGDTEVVADMVHDFAGNRVRLSRDGQTWRMDYDLHGNLIAEQQPSNGDAVAHTTTMSYDALDRIESRVIARRSMSGQEVERLGLGAEMHHYDQPTHKNSVGRLSYVERQHLGRVDYDYTVFGELARERRSFAVRPRGSLVQSVVEIHSTYNATGQPKRVEHADGATATLYDYDERGLPRAVFLETPGESPVLLAELHRNRAGYVTERLSALPATQTWSYDDLGRPNRHEVSAISPAGSVGVCTGLCVVAGEALDFDSVGNVRRATDLATDLSISYQYDARDQLLVATSGDAGASYQAEFGYDAFGRVDFASVRSELEAAKVWNRDVSYDYERTAGDLADPDAVRRLVDRSTGAVRATLDYDRWGALTHKHRDGQPLALVRSGANQIVEAARGPAGAKETHYYLADTRVLSYRDEFDGEAARLRHWAGDTEIWHAPDGSVIKTRVDVSLAGSVVARVDDKDAHTPSLLFTGALGSVLAVADENGEVTTRFGYGPFGEVLYEDGPESDEFTKRYNGKEHDALSELVYYGYRYYDDDTLSWTSADPLYRYVPDFAWTDPRRSNLYVFNLQNPVRYVDPDGRWVSDEQLNGKAAMMGKDSPFGNRDADQAVKNVNWDDDVGKLLVAVVVEVVRPDETDVAIIAGAGAIDGPAPVGELVGAGVSGIRKIFKAPGKAKRAIQKFKAARKAAKNAPDARKAAEGAKDAKKAGKADDVSGGGGGCFVAGTPVLTPQGLRPIESIRVGDLVYATEPERGVEGFRPVQEVFVRPRIATWEVVARAQTGEKEALITTAEHPFWTENRGWVEASELAPGDSLRSANGHELVVASAEPTGERTTVYNFMVADLHTYHVGGSGILVHNNDNCPGNGAEGGGKTSRAARRDAMRANNTPTSRAATSQSGSSGRRQTVVCEWRRETVGI